MIPEAYRIMKKLIKIVPDSESPVELLRENALEIDLNKDLRIDLNGLTDDPVGMFRYLQELGYIKICSKNPSVYYVTYEGFHMHWVTLETALKTFVLPIMVSLATTLFTLCIKALL